MPNIHMTIPHNLSRDEALKRVQKLLGEVRQQYAGSVTDLNERWHGHIGSFSFKTMGMDVTGMVTVGDKEVELEGTLPFAATFFKGKIEQTIRDRALSLLS